MKLREKEIELEGNKYKVYEDGRVFSCHYNKFLTGSVNSRGYQEIKIANGKTRRVHRLVAEAFIPCDGNMDELIVNHIDGDKLNNKVSNLEWGTQLYNVQEAVNTGLHDGYGTEKAKEVAEYMETCSTGENFHTIAEKFGVSHYFVGRLYRRQVYENITYDMDFVDFVELGITEELADEVCKYFASNPNAKYEDVQEKFNLSKSSVIRIKTGTLFPEIAKKYNIQLRNKPDETTVRNICLDLINTKDTYDVIAARRGVTKSTVMRIKNKKSFADIVKDYDFSNRK